MTGPNWKLNDDLTTVTITFPTAPPVELQIDVAEVETMLLNLGRFRALMQPPVPRDYALGQVCTALQDPRWVTEPEAMQGNSLIHIRDPRFGWLNFILTRESSTALMGFLQAQLDLPPPAPTGKSN